VRVRSAWAAAGAVAVIFGISAVAFVAIYRASLVQAVDDSASQQAQILAGDLTRDGTLPATALRTGPSEQTVAQVFDPAEQ
jgi:hypothetical protein